MRLHVTITVDFRETVRPEMFERFDAYLEESGWTRTELASTWTARFKRKYDAEEAQRIARRHVKKAAATAGVSNYAAAIQTGIEPPKTWHRP